MKKIILFAILIALAVVPMSATIWDFTTVSDADVANLAADADAWEYDSSNDRYKSLTLYTAEALTANGEDLELTEGLLFTTTTTDAVRIDVSKGRIALNKVSTVTIPNLTAGQTITVSCKSSSSSVARGLTTTNITATSGYFDSTTLEEQTNVGTVTEDGDVTLVNTGGLYVYSIIVKDANNSSTDDNASDDHATTLNTSQRQVQLTTTDNEVKYYNTDELASIDIDKEAGIVAVIPSSAEWEDVYTQSISNISFSKPSTEGAGSEIANGGITITEAEGWCESLYAIWDIYDGATSYSVYVKGGKYSDYTAVDAELIRNYGTYGRVDVVGLAPGTGYEVKVVPIIDGVEVENLGSTASDIVISAYDRSGFAFLHSSGIGAYNNDGTLKDSARVLYVTASAAATVELGVVTGKKEETFTGLQAIINAYQKGYEDRPLDVRIIGTITDSDMDYFASSSEGLQVKGKNNSTEMNITIEGIGDDATIWGFGFLLRNAVSVELRNFAIMLCMDDCVSIDTDNKYCWIHNLDLFYGQTGSDSDQAKGDGTVDVKGDSQYITIAYNHFWDSGKSSLCGMKSETGPNYIDYHHNWFDHSDSRHPRVRTMSVHVWNNYYDGCSKYGVGATTASSVFVESNYFRHTKSPMLISEQGTDAKGDGTFSSEDGGMIKSYGNVYAEKGSSSYYTPITHSNSATSFDCYEASSRDEQVPESCVTKQGGTTYNNFDTDDNVMHSYSPTTATDVPSVVTGFYGAGRLNKGDFSWAFDNSSADTDYAVDSALKAALESYESSLIGSFE